MLGWKLKSLVVGSAVIGGLLTGCGDDDSSTSGDTVTGSATEGEAAVAARICASCHTGSDGLLAGQTAGTNGPNITPDDDTGIGSWSTAQIVKALLTGVDDEGDQLCNVMPVYGTLGMTETEAQNIAAYLKSIPAVSNNAGEPVGCD